MPEVRVEYPFQISYKDERILGSLICLRGETAEELGQEFVQVTAIFDAIFGQKPAEEAPAEPPKEVKASPNPSGPLCGFDGCGQRMEWREGESATGPWKGWFCPSRERAHKPIWVPVKKDA